MRVRPVSRPALLAELADRIAGFPASQRVRVAVDGPPPAQPEGWVEDLVPALRLRGRLALHVPADGFLLPASQRFEFGRTNPDAFYERWRDDDGLRREVLVPAGPSGDGRVLPSLWDVRTDRATRAAYVDLPPGAVVLVSGALLLGTGLPFDLEMHLELPTAALARCLQPELAWTLPAFERYANEVDPAGFADVVVRVGDPRRPAVVDRDAVG